MGIEQLRLDYKKSTGHEPNVVLSDELSAECPAGVWPNCEIRIWSGLTDENKTEAEAHELYHIMLRCEGLVAFKVNVSTGSIRFCSDDVIYLENVARELNNAISHWYLITQLHEKYQIESKLQKILREPPIDELLNDISGVIEHKPLLHHYGLMAYDISRTNLNSRSYVDKIIGSHDEIGKAYNASIMYLDQIKIYQPIKVQQHHCKCLFDQLGYQDCFDIWDK